MKEIWKQIEENWEVSSYGRIRNRRTKRILKIRHRNDGYLDVKLSYKRFLLHRLVAIAFLPNPNGYAQVNHKNGRRDDPSIFNLEWCDQFHNMKHAVKNGLFPDRRGTKNGRVTINEEDVRNIRFLLDHGYEVPKLAKRMNVSVYVVRNIKRGLTWRHVK